MNVLVTGAAGLYGRELVDQLVHEPSVERVVGVDNFSRKFLPESPFARSDEHDVKFALERKSFRNITPQQIDAAGIDVVVHLAASISIPESMESLEKQLQYVRNNITNTVRLLNTLKATERKPWLIYASSPEVYGNPIHVPMEEEHPRSPLSIYAMSKVAAECAIFSYNQWFGYPATIIRNFNTFGPNQNVWRDAAVVTNFICKALQGQPIIIHGDGVQTRDFQYVKDAASAYRLVALQAASRKDGETTLNGGKAVRASDLAYNIGTGVQTSINDLASLVMEISGSDIPISHVPGRPSDLKALEADWGKIRNELGWQPSYTLAGGLSDCIPWYAEQLGAKGLLGRQYAMAHAPLALESGSHLQEKVDSANEK